MPFLSLLASESDALDVLGALVIDLSRDNYMAPECRSLMNLKTSNPPLANLGIELACPFSSLYMP